MKFEQLFSFLKFNFTFKTPFVLNFFTKISNLFTLNFFFNWKIANYGDAYWFLYSNKKSLHELRYLSKTNKLNK